MKRDSFPFSIVRMSYMSSNMPSKIFSATLGAEVLSIARTTTESENFNRSYAKKISRMMKQGGTIRRIKECLHKISGQNFKLF